MTMKITNPRTYYLDPKTNKIYYPLMAGMYNPKTATPCILELKYSKKRYEYEKFWTTEVSKEPANAENFIKLSEDQATKFLKDRYYN